jgi:hypothetical protein
MCSASQGLHHARRLRPVPDRALTDEIGERSANAAMNSAPSPAASAAAAGSTRCWCARRSSPSASTASRFTKLDVLDGFDEIKICVGYELDGKRIDHLPAAADAQKRVKPIYESMEGWSETTQGARRWADLPAQAIKYVRRVEELIVEGHLQGSSRITPSYFCAWHRLCSCCGSLLAQSGSV